MIELSPERVLSVVTERASQKSATLLVFWLRVIGDRSQYQHALRHARGALSLVPLIVREGFVNPNGIHSDLSDLIGANRDECDGLDTPFTVSNPLIIVLLARTDLGLPQVSSPAMLPEWLPGLGGRSVEVAIENLATAAAAPLNAAEARVDFMLSALFQLEGVLLGRLLDVLNAEHGRSNALFTLLKEDGSAETFRQFLEGAARHRTTVQQASAFRPSAAEGQSLVGRLMRVMNCSSPDALNAVGEALAKALMLNGAQANSAKDSLPAVLLRPTTRHPDPTVRVARNILISVFASAQFATAAAHADDYPSFLVVLLQGISYNLRETVQDLAEYISSLAPPPPRVIPAQYRRE